MIAENEYWHHFDIAQLRQISVYIKDLITSELYALERRQKYHFDKM